MLGVGSAREQNCTRLSFGIYRRNRTFNLGVCIPARIRDGTWRRALVKRHLDIVALGNCLEDLAGRFHRSARSQAHVAHRPRLARDDIGHARCARHGERNGGSRRIEKVGARIALEQVRGIDFGHERTQAYKRRVLTDVHGVATRPKGAALEDGLAFLGHGNLRDERAVLAADDAGTLVDEQVDVDLLLFQVARHKVVAADFLAVARGNVDIEGRGKARLDKLLKSLQDAQEIALDIKRTAPPDATFGDFPAEGLIGPRALGIDDVLVAHKEQGRLFFLIS